MSDEVSAAARAFLDSFEAVFHEDWEYTKGQMGVASDDGAATNFLREIFGEPPKEPDPDKTFLRPGETVEELEYINWGNYQSLLERYAVLCKALGRASVAPK
jgi:hypothetical protein